MKKLSIVIPTWNEEGNILPIVLRIDAAMKRINTMYELIFVDDNSTDNTQTAIKDLSRSYPISLWIKKGRKGKAFSLLEGFSYAKYNFLCMIDADLQYPPEAIPAMLKKIGRKNDIIVANRNEKNINLIRKLFSHSFRLIFGRLIHTFDCDVQSGLKVFKKEIIERIDINPTSWTFDLALLTKARNAGYSIGTVDIMFDKRFSGKAKIGLLKASLEIGLNALFLKFAKNEIIPFSLATKKRKGDGFHYKGKPFVPHTDLPMKRSAIQRLTLGQILILSALLCFFIIALFLNWHLVLLLLISLVSFLYFSDLLFNFFLIYRSFSKTPEIKITKKAIQKIPDSFWPIYTVFCPLYKEWSVVPQFIKAMSDLDYPKEKLQVMLLLEEDDKETIEKVKEFSLPFYFQVVIIPDAKPKTKPKAMNFGMKFAKGEFIVIYDAEDIPEKDQLKKAVLAFQEVGLKTVCLQAKLNFYNPHQNLLTRIFTAEYSLWFDLVLTGLQSINAPIPLGGTSNHFRAGVLEKIKGWDAFNVTEDADLGMRLVKEGYRTGIIDSTTYEEANSDYINWFNQRTRWVKGYIQTYFVHMRNLREFKMSLRNPDAITFQLVIGGKILSMFINPFMWTVTISYFVFRPIIGTFIDSFFPGPLLYIAMFSLIFGNFLYYYYYVIGCAKRNYYDIIKYLFLIPFYWLAMSVAAWIATYKFIHEPYYWSKTVHGLHLQDSNSFAKKKVPLFRLSFLPIFDKE